MFFICFDLLFIIIICFHYSLFIIYHSIIHYLFLFFIIHLLFLICAYFFFKSKKRRYYINSMVGMELRLADSNPSLRTTWLYFACDVTASKNLYLSCGFGSFVLITYFFFFSLFSLIICFYLLLFIC